MPQVLHSVVVRRREDFLALTVHLYGFAPETDDGGATVLRRRDTDGYIVVELPPQHLLEGVVAYSAGGPQDADPVSRGVLAGASRISRRVPDAVTELPYTAAALLDLASWPLVVPPAAVTDADDGVELRLPEDTETALEIPWRLFLAPGEAAGFAHAAGPVSHAGRTEVWHARLGTRAEGADGEWEVHEYLPPGAGARAVRAVWSGDPGLEDFLRGNDPGQIPLVGGPFQLARPSAEQRAQIVYATANRANPRWRPGPVDVDQLTVSAAGGWLVSRLTADLPVPTDPDVPLDLESWTHRTTAGRDQYVRTVTRGYCAPTGHRFSEVEVVERIPDGQGRAVLEYQRRLVCRDPLRTFGSWPGEVDPALVRQFPFTQIRLTSLVSPPLDPIPPGPPSEAWVAQVNGAPYAFTAVGTDLEGREVPLAIPMLFVRATEAFDHGVAEQVADIWNSWAATHVAPIGRLPAFGRRLTYAPAKVRGDGTTALDTYYLTLAVRPPDDYDEAAWRAQDVPPFVPYVETAEVSLAAAQGLAANPLGTAQIRYDPDYAAQGFARPGATPAQRAAEVFAELVQPVPLTMAGERVGALAVPNLAIAGLSRELGPVGALPADGFDPAALFAGLGAELLGAVPLAGVVARETGAVTRAPRIVREELLGPGGVPSAAVVRFSWQARLKADPAGILQPHGDATGLALHGWTRTELTGTAPPSYEMTGETGGFDLNFFGSGAGHCVTVSVTRLRFFAAAGRPAVLDPQIGAVTFAGPLRFVEKIKDYLSFGGNGPYVEVSPQRIVAGVAVALPSIQVGVFSLANLAVRTELEVSLAGDPARLRFALCSRAQPFQLTVALFGGGGFFALTVGTAGLELVEAALEFGAACSINLGVASGSVSVMAGIYLKLEKKDGGTATTLEGYFRLNGEMSVLGLISLSIELYLSLRYEEYPGGTNKVVGRATIHVEVEVFLFSASVEVSCERRLGGTANDPTFADQVSQADWEEYCAAFAPVPA